MNNSIFQHRIFKDLYNRYDPPVLDIWEPVNNLLYSFFDNIVKKYWYVFLIIFVLIIGLAYRYNNRIFKKSDKNFRNELEEYNKSMRVLYTEPIHKTDNPRIIKSALS